jgi:hypothetical protein
MMLLLLFKYINSIHPDWNQLLPELTDLCQQVNNFAIDIVGSPPDVNNSTEGYQIRTIAIGFLTIIVSYQRITPDTYQTMLQYIANSLHVDDISVLISIHDLFFILVKTFYSDRASIMNLFTETTGDYYTENVPDKIIMININFWNNLIIEELTHHLDTSHNEKILYNTSNFIVPLLIQTLIIRAGNNTREDNQIIIQITALLSRLFILIPSSLLSIYKQVLPEIISSDNFSAIYTCILLNYSIYRNNPSNINKECSYESIQFNLSSTQQLTSSSRKQIHKIHKISKSKKQSCQ